MSVITDRDRFRDEVRAVWSDPWRACEWIGLAQVPGVKRQASGLSVHCPSHQPDNDASCSVTAGPDGRGLRVKCFACDFSGDDVLLCARVWGLDSRRDFLEVLRRMGELAGISAPDAPDGGAPWRLVVVRPPLAAPTVDLGALWESLPPIDVDGFDYLRSRGLEEVADLCRRLADLAAPRPEPPAGHERDGDGKRTCGGGTHCATCRWEYASSGYAVALPLRDVEGRVVAVQVRNVRAEKEGERDNRFLALGPTSAGVFGDPGRVQGARNVIVAEGMTDTLAALAACRGARVSVVVGVAGVNAAAALEALPWRGKRVLVASDPDEAGDLFFGGRTEEQAAAETQRRGKPVRAVAGFAEKLRKAGAHPLRARPEEGYDLAALFKRGDNLVAFFRRVLAEQASFRTASARLSGEREERLAIGPKILPFGVGFLDVCLGGIWPRDVVLIGGVSQGGKTELARIITSAVVNAGRRVHYFSLEGEPRELERRDKYARIVDRLIARVGSSRYYDRLNFLDWSRGYIDDLTAPVEAEIDAELRDLYAGRFFTRYPDNEDFGIDHFEQAVLALADETDLFVLDHFHYLDFGDQENRVAKAAIKRIRRLALFTKKPILVVCHIRKATGGASKRLIPVLDDFHGSSDVFKMATKAILLAPASDRPNSAPHLWKTYLSAGKCRIEGSRARYAACVVFDARRRAYEADFILGTVSPGGDKFTEVEARCRPGWARRGRQELPEASPPDRFAERDLPDEPEPGSDG